MTTELRQNGVERRNGSVVLKLTKHGIVIRGHRKQKKLFIDNDSLIRLGLQLEHYVLTGDEWNHPIKALQKLSRTPRAKAKASLSS